MERSANESADVLSATAADSPVPQRVVKPPPNVHPTLPPDSWRNGFVQHPPVATVAELAEQVDAVALVEATDKRTPVSVGDGAMVDTVVWFKHVPKGLRELYPALTFSGTFTVRQPQDRAQLEAGRRYVLYLDMHDGTPTEPASPVAVYGEIEHLAENGLWRNLTPHVGTEATRLLLELETTAEVADDKREGHR